MNMDASAPMKRAQFEALLEDYHTAVAAETAYDAAYTGPLDAAKEQEIRRLGKVRMATEDAVMAVPSPDAAAFASKVLIATDAPELWAAKIEEEAKRFAASPTPVIDQSPHSGNTGKVTMGATATMRHAQFYALLADVSAAKAAERAYDAANCSDIDNTSDECWAESERLAEIRSVAEEAVMALPSPDANGLAAKYLIAHGDGRETDVWNDMLEAEAKYFADTQPLMFTAVGKALVVAWAEYDRLSTVHTGLEKAWLSADAPAKPKLDEVELAERAMCDALDAAEDACQTMLACPAATVEEIAIKLEWSLRLHEEVRREDIGFLTRDIAGLRP